MRKEEVVSGFVMCIVSGLVLVGFTIAWFTIWHFSPVVTGLEVRAAEIGDLDVEIDETDLGEFAPGSSGKVTLEVTPKEGNVFGCRVVPRLLISQDNLTAEEVAAGEGVWYPQEGQNAGADDDSAEDATLTMAELYEIACRHIRFFSDEDHTEPITEDVPLEITWEPGSEATTETISIYWEWYYEYPLTASEREEISEAERELLDTYDEEDMILGNNISNIKFDFAFAIQ